MRTSPLFTFHTMRSRPGIPWLPKRQPRCSRSHDDVPLRVVLLVGVDVESNAVRAVPLVKVAADGQAVRVAQCGEVQAFDAVHRVDEFVGLEGQHVGQGGVEAHLERIDQDVPVVDPVGQDLEGEIIARSIDPSAEVRASVEDQGGIDDLYVRGRDVELEVVLLSGGYFLFPVGFEAREQPVGHCSGDLGKEIVALDVSAEQVFGFDRKAAGKTVDLFGSGRCSSSCCRCCSSSPRDRPFPARRPVPNR